MFDLLQGRRVTISLLYVRGFANWYAAVVVQFRFGGRGEKEME